MKLINLVSATALSLLLAACGGQQAPRETVTRQPVLAATVAVPPATATAPLRVGYVEYLPPDAGMPGLRRYQPVQLLLELDPADAKSPALELQASGRVLGRIALVRHGAGHWRATIPAAWAVNGLNWRAVAANHGPSMPQTVPLAD